MKQLWLTVCAAALLFTSCAAERGGAAGPAPSGQASSQAAPAAVQGVQDTEDLDAALEGLLPFGPAPFLP